MSLFFSGTKFVRYLLTPSSTTSGHREKSHTSRPKKLCWLFAICALAFTVQAQAAGAGYYLSWPNGGVQLWHDSVAAADKVGRAAAVALSATNPNNGPLSFGGPYKFLTEFYYGYPEMVAVNYWADDATWMQSGFPSGPSSFFHIREYICADKHEWDNEKNVCRRPIKLCPKHDVIGKPCDPATGNEHYTETDYTGAGAFPLSFSRTYNSKVFGNGRLGFKWISNLGDPTGTLTLSITTQVTPHIARVPRPDGGTVFFRKVGGVWSSDAHVTDTLVQVANGWVYTQRNGTVETYDNTTNSVGNSTGRLISITNAAGLSQTLTYDPVTGFLRAVTDPFGHSLTFTYDAKDRLSTMTNPSGGVTSYTYDDTNNVGNLIAVTYPDGKVKRYKYNEPGYVVAGSNFTHALTGIIDENNNRYASLTYDSHGRVIINQLADVGFGGPQQKYTLSYDYPTQTTVTDAANNKVVMTFATNIDVINLVSKKNLSDNKTLYQTFDPNNNLICKQDEEGRVTTWTYNSINQKLSETVGQTGTCSAPVATPALRTTTYQYLSPTLDLPTVTESPSVYGTNKKRVVVGYTGNLPTTLTQSGFTPSGAAVSRTVTMTYNTFGQVTSIDGPRSDVVDVTTLTYNVCTTGGGCGQLQRVTNALGQITSYDSYDANGRLLQMTDPNGLVTVYTYDARGRVKTLTQTAPAGGGSRVTSYAYDAAGNILTTTLPTGLVLTYTYDAALNLRRVLDSLGNYIDYGYDLKGNRTQTYTYDASGTLVRAVDLAFNARNRVSQLNAGGSITKQLWDAVGNLTSVTDPNTVALDGSAATGNSYDALNRLFQTVDLLSGVTQYSYDPNDRLKTVTAPNGSLTQYQYDDLGNLVKEISPDRGTSVYSYDLAGNLVSQTDARGITVGYVYDALNRLVRVDYPGTAEDVSYTYDSGSGCSLGVGRLCTVVDGSGSTGYGYDAFGNVLTQVHTELGVTYTTRYTYDAGNRVTSLTYPNGRVVSTPRDVLGRIGSVATLVNGTAVTLSANRTYRADGLLLGQSLGNGVSEVRQYDTQGQLRYQTIGTTDTRLYGYDANGNLKSLQSIPLVGAYDYDLLNRLKLDQRTTTATVNSAFTYDANGNRKTENSGTYSYLANSNRLSTTPVGSIVLDAAGNTTSDGTRAYTYNNAGQVSTVAGAQYSYNAQRQRTRKVVGGVGTVFHYDLQGNLIAESDTAGVIQRSYVWAEGQPLALIEPTTTLPADILLDDTQATFTGSWATSTALAGYYGSNYRTHIQGTGNDKAVWTFTVPSTGTYQVYARWVAASTHASNAPFTVRYNGGSQVIAVNQRASGGQWVSLGSFSFSSATAGSVTLTDNANGLVIADAVKLVAISGGTASEVVRYLHSDHLNTPRLATNQQGQKVWGWEGSAFGSTAPTGSVTINLRRPGEYWDQESSLIYNHHRYLDPVVDRYITVDPIGLADGLNPYVHADNNPLRWTDPTGLYTWTGTMISGEFIAGIGAGGITATLESDCIDGKKAFVKVKGIGFGVGGRTKRALPEVEGGSITFDDFRLSGPIDPSVFNGRFEMVGAGLVIGGGLSHSKIRCGSAFATDTGFTWGFNLGASGVFGSCTVIESRIEDCCKK